MTDALNSTGLSIDALEIRLSRIHSELRSSISSILDLSTDQPTGQIVQILTEHEQQVVELLQELHSAIDPDQSTGQALDAVSSITGTYREAATKGTVTLKATLGAVITVPAGSIASVLGDPDNQWITTEDVTSVGAGDYNVEAIASASGAIQALAGTITVIVTPVAGWTAIDNVSNATEGSPVETDTELRLRREIEVTLGGSASSDSIRAAISQLTGVEETFVYENQYGVAIAPMPPHSIEAVYWTLFTGGDLDDLRILIAGEVYSEKAAGVESYGLTTTVVEDDAGNNHLIKTTLADEQVILVEVDLDQGEGYVGDTAVETAIASWAASDLGIGDSIYLSKISGIVIALTGVENVSAVRLAIFPAAAAAVDITSIDGREIGTIITGNITVAS